MCNRVEHADRVPWEDDFPDVVTFCKVDTRDRKESYIRAKYAKNYNQAEELMADVSHTKEFKEGLLKLKEIAKGKDVILVPIHSVERSYDPRSKKPSIGSNPLPMAIAMAISDETGWKVDTDIVQTNIVGHTGADSLSRFAYPALFEGNVEEDKAYIIIDDHVTMGGTVANCRGHIEKNGGKVIGLGSLTADRGSICVRLTQSKKNRLMNVENFSTIGCHTGVCEKVLGYSIDCMTNSEATRVLHHMENAKKHKPSYNLQNFFDEVINKRSSPETDAVFSQNKKQLCQCKLMGVHQPFQIVKKHA